MALSKSSFTTVHLRHFIVTGKFADVRHNWARQRWVEGPVLLSMQNGRRMKLVKNLLGLLLLPILLIVMLRWFEYRQVYHPYRALAASGAELERPWEEVYFEAADQVKLHGWFFPADPQSARSKIAVLFCHGNGGNISHRLGHYQELLDLGVAVFAFDYRGYGRSSGAPSEEGTYLDAEAAYQWLRGRGFGESEIIALGESLGGAVAAELALRASLKGVVLLSTFTSIPDVGADIFPFLPTQWLCRIRYDTLSKLPELDVPVLVMHSRADSIIRFRHGERLFAAANEPKMFWEIYGDHNDTLFTGRARYVEGLERYLERLEGSDGREINFNSRL
jgi:uncharacterized protein